MTQEERERAKKAREKRIKERAAKEKTKAEIEKKTVSVKDIKEEPIPEKKNNIERYKKPQDFDKTKCSFWGSLIYDDKPKERAELCFIFLQECEWETCYHQKEYLEKNKLPLILID
jgi:hypothetical protein